MKIVSYFLMIVLLTTSCSSYQATVKSHQQREFESVKVKPDWKYQQRQGKKWILPVIGLSAGAAYGYQNEFTYEGETYTGSKNAAIWGGAGLLAGAMLNGILRNSGRKRKQFDLSQSEQWLRNYNRTTGNNYVLYGKEPDNTLILVPRDRFEDLERFEDAKIRGKIEIEDAKIERIILQKEQYLRQQEAEKAAREKTTEEQLALKTKRNNIVNYMEWEPVSITGAKEVYPSAIITATTYTSPRKGNSSDMEAKNIANFIGFSFTPEVSGATVFYEIESTDHRFIQKSSGEVTVTKGQIVYPSIHWKTQELLENKTLQPLKVIFRIRDNAGNYDEKKLDLVVLSINECILWINRKRINWILPAYVNEQEPLIEEILKEALDKKYIDAWTGYQKDWDLRSVQQQVKAVWRVLEDRGFKYSSVTGAGISGQSKIVSQYIRTTKDAINGEQSNCIDGTLLFASILKRIDINPYVIIYPGHANLAFDLYEDKSKKVFLEMTQLGYAPFESALISGERYFNKTSLSEKTILDIQVARQSGIKPLAH